MTVLDDDKQSCLEVIQTAVADRAGVMRVQMDTQAEQVTFDYDPALVSEETIDQMARAVRPVLQQRWQTCTLRLGRQGGRACESCAQVLEHQLSQVQGVRRATASYIGGTLSIQYDHELLSPEEVLAQVQRLGVPVELPQEMPAQSVWQRLRGWLESNQAQVILTALTLLGLLAGFVAERLGAAVVVMPAYVLAYLAGGYCGLRAGLQSLRYRAIDVDLLMILAALGAAVVGAPFEGAMLLFLFSLSNVLQSYALDRTRNAIRSLMKLRPSEALVLRAQGVITLPIEQVLVGDLILVRPGDRLPLDGVVLEGESSLDQSPITGESMPVSKGVGDTVFAGSINQQGALEVKVTRLAADSTIAKLIQLVEEAHSKKAKTQRFIDTAEQYYAMGVIIATALAITTPILFLGETFQSAFYRAMTLMVAASPCALVISTPATVLSAIGNGARRGILFKGGAYLEKAAAIRVIAFDKTGTLTVGQPRLTDVVPLPGALSADELLRLAASVEARSEHPLARAIVQAARERGLDLFEVTAFQSSTGQGVQGAVDGRLLAVGNVRYYAPFVKAMDGVLAAAVAGLQEGGKTAVIVAELDAGTMIPLGVLGIADVLRENAAAVMAELKRIGVSRLVMLTGDNSQVAEAIGRQAGVDEVFAGLLPEDKMAILKQLGQSYGPVAMVGDGVNDAPALALADIGIAMGAAGTDVALETADVVLMADDLGNLPYAIALSRKTRATLVQNLVFASGVILVLIGAVLGFSLALPLSVVGHEGSTVLVSLNGLRLLAFRRR